MEKERDEKGRFKSSGRPWKKRIRTEYNKKYWKEVRTVGERKERYIKGKRKSYIKNRNKDMARSKKWASENREKSMAIKKKHFVTKREKQAGRPISHQCDICGTLNREMKKGLCFDHCHETGNFRGWICSRCNLALGLVKDNTQTLEAMIRYLQTK